MLGQEAKKGYLFDILYIKVCCVFSFESPHQGDSNEYTQYTNFNMKKNILNILVELFIVLSLRMILVHSACVKRRSKYESFSLVVRHVY